MWLEIYFDTQVKFDVHVRLLWSLASHYKLLSFFFPLTFFPLLNPEGNYRSFYFPFFPPIPKFSRKPENLLYLSRFTNLGYSLQFLGIKVKVSFNEKYLNNQTSIKLCKPSGIPCCVPHVNYCGNLGHHCLCKPHLLHSVYGHTHHHLHKVDTQ